MSSPLQIGVNILILMVFMFLLGWQARKVFHRASKDEELYIETELNKDSSMLVISLVHGIDGKIICQDSISTSYIIKRVEKRKELQKAVQ